MPLLRSTEHSGANYGRGLFLAFRETASLPRGMGRPPPTSAWTSEIRSLRVSRRARSSSWAKPREACQTILEGINPASAAGAERAEGASYLGAVGRRREAPELLGRVVPAGHRDFVNACGLAAGFPGIHDAQSTRQWIETALSEHSPDL